MDVWRLPNKTWGIRRRLLGASVLCVLCLVVYYPVVGADFIWDDDAYVLGNRLLRDFGGLLKIWVSPSESPQYYPFVFTTFWVEHQLWGVSPLGYHLVNLALHAGCAVCLWLLLGLLTVPGAWLIAAIFAVHPLNVESVAWVAERKNVLSGLLYLLSALAFLRSRCGSNGTQATFEGAKGPRWRWDLFAAGCFVLALLSKTVVASLPLVLLLLLWWKQPHGATQHLPVLVPFLALGVAAGLITAGMEVAHVGASGPEWDFSILERLLLASRTSLFYVWKLFWPANLLFSYPRWALDDGAWVQYAAPLCVVSFIAVLWWQRHRWGRGPLVAVLYYLVTLSPASGLFNVYPMRYSFVADHFQYLAGIGVISLAVGGTATVLPPRLTQELTSRRIDVLLCAALLFSLGLVAQQRVRVFFNQDTLWSDTLAGNPSSWLAANNLGLVRYDQRRFEEAEGLFLHALRYKTDEASIYNNLGMVRMSQGRIDEAVESYRKSLYIDSSAAVSWVNLGIALAAKGLSEQAIDAYDRAINIDASYAPAFYHMGYELNELGHAKEAVEAYRTALLTDPEYADAHNNLGTLLAIAGEIQAAVPHFCEAARLRPSFTLAQENLEAALRSLRDVGIVDVGCP